MSRERLKKIEISGPGINFDYAHFLPSSPKCSVLHGHSSTVSVTVVGRVVDGVVVEFGELKKVVKKVVDGMDHKLIVCRKYLTHLEDGKVKVAFDGIGGHYEFILPINSVYVIESDSTVENISEHIAVRLRELLPPNVQRIHVRMSEGFGKYATSSI
ncbi:MAG: 6-carboxytetrahydropterin synthase [Candidatus Caldarchaeum sp.]